MTTLIKLSPVVKLVKFSGPRRLITVPRGTIISKVRTYLFGMPIRVPDGLAQKYLQVAGVPSDAAPLIINKV